MRSSEYTVHLNVLKRWMGNQLHGNGLYKNQKPHLSTPTERKNYALSISRLVNEFRYRFYINKYHSNVLHSISLDFSTCATPKKKKK